MVDNAQLQKISTNLSKLCESICADIESDGELEFKSSNEQEEKKREADTEVDLQQTMAVPRRRPVVSNAVMVLKKTVRRDL